MGTIGAFEAKTHLSQILDKVAAGKEFVITKHGKPVARLVPVRKTAEQPDLDEVVRQIRASRKGRKLGDVTIRQLIDEGRRF